MDEQISKGHCLKKKLHFFAQFWDECQFLDIEFSDRWVGWIPQRTLGNTM